MSAEKPIRGISDLLPRRTFEEPQVVGCKDSKEGVAFFKPLNGAVFSSTILARYDDHDAIAFSGQDSAIILLGPRGSFIAVEHHDSTTNAQVKLAFREDIRSADWDLTTSMLFGEDVTSPGKEKTVGMGIDTNATEVFSEEAFGGNPTLEAIKPTWHTEHWVTIYMAGNRSVTVRADRSGLSGAVMVHGNRMDILNLGDNKIQDFDFKQPVFSKIPASLVK